MAPDARNLEVDTGIELTRASSLHSRAGEVGYELERQTCLTTLHHEGKNIKDHLAHYFGCIEYGQRPGFFDDEALWTPWLHNERQLLQKKISVAVSINTQLRRIQVLRCAIESETEEDALSATPTTSNGHTGSVRTNQVQDVIDSHNRWKDSRDFQQGIRFIRDWREEKKKKQEKDAREARRRRDQAASASASAPTATPASATTTRPRIVPQDVLIIPILRKKLDSYIKYLRSLDPQINQEEGHPPQEPSGGPAAGPATATGPAGAAGPAITTKDVAGSLDDRYELERDVNAYVVNYRPDDDGKFAGYSIDNEHIKGQFPDQRIALKYLLEDHSNSRVLKKDRPDGDLLYIHVPSNNMHWVEKLMASYYGKFDLDLDASHETSTRTEASMLLRPQYWRGQQHSAGKILIHARHMRPICERVSSDLVIAEDVPKNVVLFMPYLHWETDRKREAVARMIDNKVEKHRDELNIDKWEESEKRKQERQDLKRDLIRRPIFGKPPDRTDTLPKVYIQNLHDDGQQRPYTFPGAALGFVGNRKKPAIRVIKGRLIVDDSPLGQFLLDAARLYETMTNYRDKCMIDKYLFHKAPLHPRRTLDQAHFWTLKYTRARDRDQVVYRATYLDPEKAHKPIKWRKPCYTHLHHRHRAQENAEDDVVPNKFKTFWNTSKDDDKKHPTYYWSCLENRKNSGLDAQQEKRRLARLRRSSAGADGSEPVRSPDTKLAAVAVGAAAGDAVVSGIVVQGVPKNVREATNGVAVVPTRDGSSTGDRASTVPSDKTATDTAKLHPRCEQCRDDIRKVSRVVMVDQLWMWILDENTIITCFPRRYGVNKRDDSGVYKSIRMRLKTARYNQFRSVFDLALVILDECSNTFFDRTKTDENLPQVMDIFAESIGNVTNKQTTSFNHVWHWTEKAAAAYRSTMSDVRDIHVPLLDINPEGRMQREIKDIIEELDIMLSINRKHLEISRRFIKNVQYILDPDGFSKAGSSMAVSEASHEGGPFGGYDEARLARSATFVRGNTVAESPSDIERRAKLHWFRISAAELLADVNDRIQELQTLKDSAESTAQSINDLLGLKQQQASVVQAWQSVQQSEETVRQGRVIMVFTIITIVFLPLSFMSSIFGMNNNNFNETWTLHAQFRLMFPISLAIILFVCMLAFSNFVRATIWSIWAVGYNFLFVTSHLYYYWLSLRDRWSSHGLVRRAEEQVQSLRARVKKQREIDLARRRANKKEKAAREAKASEAKAAAAETVANDRSWRDILLPQRRRLPLKDLEATELDSLQHRLTGQPG